MNRLTDALTEYNTPEQLAEAFMASQARLHELVRENERLRAVVEAARIVVDQGWKAAGPMGSAPWLTPSSAGERLVNAIHALDRSALAGTEAKT